MAPQCFTKIHSLTAKEDDELCERSFCELLLLCWSEIRLLQTALTCNLVCFVVFVPPQADFPTVIGVTLDREDGSTPMETDGDKGKQSGTTYYIDTNQLRVPRENMEVMSPLKNGMSKRLVQVIGEHDFFHPYIKDWPRSFHM